MTPQLREKLIRTLLSGSGKERNCRYFVKAGKLNDNEGNEYLTMRIFDGHTHKFLDGSYAYSVDTLVGELNHEYDQYQIELFRYLNI